jgi:secreted PhoX family phosphatase
MAAFAGKNGRVILIRNHELMPTNFSAFGKDYEFIDKVDQTKMYDMRKGNLPCSGGTTTLVINEATLEVEKSWMSLGGTLRNCAGGPTPWGSWVSCEEIVIPPSNGYEYGHGYNFEVKASEKISLADPIPLKEMGQFNHEAICIDPKTGIVYQTEDREDGLIYRFIPNTPGALIKGGKLQVLAIKGQKSMSTRNWKVDKTMFPINEALEVEWIDMDNVYNLEDDDLRRRGFMAGAAMFARGEGMWFGNGEVYFACTNGGYTKTGQIFKYIPSSEEGTAAEKNNPGTLELFLEPNNTSLLRHCDNLTVSPWGDVVFCEDNERPRAIGITKTGQFYKIAENVKYKSEFAGGVFSPSGKTYFINIQHAGLTLAIQGPWEKAANDSGTIGA